MTLAAAVRIYSSIITKHVTTQSALPISAIKAIYILRFCWGFPTTVCFDLLMPTFCSLDIQLFRQISLANITETIPSSRFPKHPAIIWLSINILRYYCEVLLHNSYLMLSVNMQCIILAELSKKKKKNFLTRKNRILLPWFSH